MSVTPAVKPVGFVPAWYFIIGNIPWSHFPTPFFRLSGPFDVLGVRPFEKSPLMSGLAHWAMIFDGEKSMAWRAKFSVGKQVVTSARRAFAPAPLGWPVRKQDGFAMAAPSGIFPVHCFR